MSNKITKGFYAAAAGAFFNDAKASVYGTEIEKIVAKNPGISLVPDMVLDAASDQASPLHDYFEWDDSTCARRYRLKQAEEIICHLRYVTVTNGREVSQRAFINVTVENQEEETEYVPVRRVIDSADLKEKALRRAMKDLEKWCVKYEYLHELGIVVRAIKALEKGRSE